MKACVIGAGSWGSAFALHLSRLTIDTHLWVREEEIYDSLLKDRENKVFLPGYVYPASVSFFSDVEEALEGTEVIFSAIPSQFCRGIFAKIARSIKRKQIVVSLAKGIEEGSLKRISEIIEEIFVRSLPHVAVLSGPSFAKEVAEGHPTAVVVASKEFEVAKKIQMMVSNLYFRTYTSDDVTGVEVAGALKNVIAVAAGIADALDFGHNTRAALITRGLAEITRLGTKMGARRETFLGLAGIGDLVLTCTARLSRNYSVGFELGKGRSLESIISGTKMVAEGIATAFSTRKLARRANVEMPISEQVYQVLYEKKDPKKSLFDLMSRTLKDEYRPEE